MDSDAYKDFPGINPAEVWAELSKREGISGVAERRARENADDA